MWNWLKTFKKGTYFYCKSPEDYNVELLPLSTKRKEQMVRVIRAFSRSENQMLSKEQLIFILDIQPASFRPVLAQFKKLHILKIVDIESPDHHVYEFVPRNQEVTESTEFSVDILPTSLATESFPLVDKFKHSSNPQDDDLHSISFTQIISALLQHRDTLLIDLTEFLNDNINTPKKSIEKLGTAYVGGARYNISYGSRSHSEVAYVEDVPFLFVLCSLTILYHLKHAEQYAIDGKGTGVDVATRIYTESLLKWLKIPINQVGRKKIETIMERWESTQFFASIYSADDDSTDVYEKGKPLFTISRRDRLKREVVAGKMTRFSPYSYVLDWNADVLKMLFETKSLFVYPSQVVSSGHIVLYIYMHLRKEYKKRFHFLFTLEEIVSFCHIPPKTNSGKKAMTEKQMYAYYVNTVWSAISKPFKEIYNKSVANGEVIKYKEPVQIRTGNNQSLRSKPFTKVYLKGELGGYLWEVIGSDLTNSDPEKRHFSVNIELINVDSVIEKSIPESQRPHFFDKNGQLSSKALKKAGRGTKSPIVFNNILPLVAEFVHNPRQKREADINMSEIIPPDLGIFDYEQKSLQYDVRKYFLKMVVDRDHEFILHPYMNQIEKQKQVKLIAKSSNRHYDEILPVIIEKMENVNFLPKDSNMVINESDFDAIYMHLKEKVSTISAMDLFLFLNHRVRSIRYRTTAEIIELTESELL